MAAFNDDFYPQGSLAFKVINVSGAGSFRFNKTLKRPKIVDAVRALGGNFCPVITLQSLDKSSKQKFDSVKHKGKGEKNSCY
ncbi:hypothetical protein A4S05_01410 [Nostoc sp. KVJ20]|nr:hypothetical protein A4S05_01410 [Nostoc sp. KVJ20]